MMKMRRGSITVFLCIVLAVLIPLCGILIDLSRYNEARKLAESSLKVCAESMLAAYDTQLKEQFGLFAMYPRDAASMEKEIYELLSDNLTPENAEGRVTDLYGFKVNKVEVIPVYNYSEPYVLEQQITEFMKYRAPAQAIGEFLEKLKTMGGLMKEGDMIEKNMDLDKKLNDMRQNMIYLSLLLGEKMKHINETSMEFSMNFLYIQNIRKNNQKADTNIKNATGFEDIQKYRDAYLPAKDILDKAIEERNQKGSLLSQAQNDLKSAQGRLQARQNDLDEAKKKKNTNTSDIEGDIAILETEVAQLSSAAQNAQSDYQNASAAADKAQSDVTGIIDNLNSRIDALLTCYNAAESATAETISFLDSLISHLDLHISCCTKAAELVNAIIPQAEQIQNEKNDLQQQIDQNPDSAVSAQIGGDLEKKLLNVDVNVLNSMAAQLEKDKNQLSQWRKAASDIKDIYLAADQGILGETGRLNALKVDPTDPSVGRIEKYAGFNEVPDKFNTYCSNISGFELYPEMEKNNLYVIPDYTLDPLPTEKERTGFNVWYGNTFEGKSDKPPEEKDNGELDKAKKSLGGSAGDIATEEVATDSAISIANLISTIESEFLPLPSAGGSVSSETNLERISGEVYNTRQDQAINPFDQPPQGYDGSIDEKQKNFFDYELERIRNLLNTVTKFLTDAGESLVKSLYVNEYIVSAFNNYTTKGLSPEYDIGWDRPHDSTYFKQGEVEYVIFGNADESKNISAAKRSVFAIRLVFNLLHVYTDPVKVSQALEIASAIAGWTIFGVPIVQNLILIGWAALESWIDAGKLMNGESVPLIKTRQSWLLDIGTLKNYLVNSVLFQVGDFVKKKAEEAIDSVASSLQETVTSIIDAQIDKVFSAIEKEWQNVSADIDKTAQDLVDGISLPDITDFRSETLDDFLASLKGYIEEQAGLFCKKIEKQGADFINDCKTALKNKIYDFIFGSSVYQNLLAKIKKLADDAVNKGVAVARDKLGGLLGSSGSTSSGGNNVLGRLIMMNYTDYLRLMLLAVPEQTKVLRVSDLMQIDMYSAAPDNCKPISRYNTAFYVKAYIDINTWVIPKGLFKKDKDGMIVVEWSMGY